MNEVYWADNTPIHVTLIIIEQNVCVCQKNIAGATADIAMQQVTNACTSHTGNANDNHVEIVTAIRVVTYTI